MILGIDEVGRGPWAGPLVVAAVVLGDASIEGLTDSKKLTKKRREALEPLIREKAAGYGIGWVHADELDRIGLSAALRVATIRAVEQVKATYHEIIIDGTINFLSETSKGRFVTTLAKADLLIPEVSAASIIAKVARDNYMADQDELYDGYRFAGHAGYGTAAHREAIAERGVTPLHRLSFAPLKQYTAAYTGKRAESLAAEELVRRGHSVLTQNWKTKYCEIDIISSKDGVLYFSEVKYRKNAMSGDGLAAITAKKLAQMRFAVEYYIASHRAEQADVRLQAISMTGTEPYVEALVEIE